MKAESNRVRFLLVFPVLLIVAASAFAIFATQGGGGPAGGLPEPQTAGPGSTGAQAPPQEPVGSGGSDRGVPRLGLVPEFSKVIAPPFVEVRFLYKAFPLVIYAKDRLDPSLFEVYAVDSLSRTVRLAWDGPSLLGEKGGLMVYQAMVRLSRGYYRPGVVELVVAYRGVGEPVNLTIMGPLNPAPLTYKAVLSGGTVAVEVKNNSTLQVTVVAAYIANCGPGQTPASNVTVPPGGQAYIQVELPPGCHGLKPLTLVVASRDSTGNMYYDYVPVPTSGGGS